MEAAGSTPKHPHCGAPRRDGQACTAPGLMPSGQCFAHDAGTQEARVIARRQGGHNRATHVRAQHMMPARLKPVWAKLEGALANVENGTLDVKRAHAMAAVARAMVAVLTAGELEERLRRLEGVE